MLISYLKLFPITYTAKPTFLHSGFCVPSVSVALSVIIHSFPTHLTLNTHWHTCPQSGARHGECSEYTRCHTPLCLSWLASSVWTSAPTYHPLYPGRYLSFKTGCRYTTPQSFLLFCPYSGWYNLMGSVIVITFSSSHLLACWPHSTRLKSPCGHTLGFILFCIPST